MIAKIEPTGTSVRNGKVQLRFSFYLEPGDARYNEHHVQVPDSLPKEWQDNPFHNHFVRVSPDATDAEILQLMVDSLAEFYGMWSRGEDITKLWQSKGREMAGDVSPQNIERCELRGLHLASRASLFEYKEQRK